MHDPRPGPLLKKIREKNGHSLSRVAKVSGYSLSYLSEIESGKKMPAPFALSCIVKAAAEPSEQDGIFSAFASAWMGKAC